MLYPISEVNFKNGKNMMKIGKEFKNKSKINNNLIFITNIIRHWKKFIRLFRTKIEKGDRSCRRNMANY